MGTYIELEKNSSQLDELMVTKFSDYVFEANIYWGFEIPCSCPVVRDWQHFQVLQPHLCPNHYEASLLARINRTTYAEYSDPDMVRFVVGLEQLVDVHGTLPYTHQAALLHAIAKTIGGLSGPDLTYYQPRLKLYWPVALEIISKVDKLHAWHGSFLLKPSETPLLRVGLRSASDSVDNAIFVGLTRRHIESQNRSALSNWLRLLRQSGVDLVAYGQKENQLLRNGRDRDGRRIDRSCRGRCRPRKAVTWVELLKDDRVRPAHIWNYRSRLLGFKIGPEVDDWDMWMTEPTDRFAGDFWNLVENSSALECHIPGAWVDDDTDDSLYWSSEDDEDDEDCGINTS